MSTPISTQEAMGIDAAPCVCCEDFHGRFIFHAIEEGPCPCSHCQGTGECRNPWDECWDAAADALGAR